MVNKQIEKITDQFKITDKNGNFIMFPLIIVVQDASMNITDTSIWSERFSKDVYVDVIADLIRFTAEQYKIDHVEFGKAIQQKLLQ